MTTTSKLPASPKPLIADPDLVRELEGILKPYTGAKLEKAQAAIRQVLGSGVMGSFSTIVAHYRAAILKAVGQSDE